MNNTQPDYAGVLADLRRRRDELDALIAGLERVAANAGVLLTAGHSPQIAPYMFAGKSIVQAAKQYLTMETEPQTVTAIADALKRGGLQKESKNFAAAVNTMLYREYKRGGSLIQLPDKRWTVATLFPNAVREPALETTANDDDFDEPTSEPPDTTDEAAMSPEPPFESQENESGVGWSADDSEVSDSDPGGVPDASVPHQHDGWS